MEMIIWLLVTLVVTGAAFCVGRQQGFDDAAARIRELLTLVDCINGQEDEEDAGE